MKSMVMVGICIGTGYMLYKCIDQHNKSLFWNCPDNKYWQSYIDGKIEPKLRLAEIPSFKPSLSYDNIVINQNLIIELCKQFAHKLYILIPQMRQDYDQSSNDVFRFIIKIQGLFAELKLTFIKHMLSRQFRIFCNMNDFYDFATDIDVNNNILYFDLYLIYKSDDNYAGEYNITLNNNITLNSMAEY